MVGIPLSPLHNVVAIGQELCLRGHSVTVLSFGERGRLKTRKYSPKCMLGYISLGELPVSEEAEQDTMLKISGTNSTLEFFKIATKGLFAPYFSAMKAPIAKVLASGAVRPDYALVSFPFGAAGEALKEHGVDFAINMPSILLPPMTLWVAHYIPPPFYHVSPYSMTIVDRLVVIGGNTVINVIRHCAAAVGFKFSAVPDFSLESWWGRLVFVNSIPGLDYPQALPPLVQYTGPVVDVSQMEPFPSEVNTWFDAIPKSAKVVYVSFGTVAYLTPRRVAAMVNSLSSTKYHVLWALPKAQQAGLPKHMPANMLVHAWIPTPRALAHPQVVAFVSHCGGNSVAESMAMGVPIVGYPQFGDQPAVCQRVADAGAGITGPVGGWVQADEVLAVVTNPAFTAGAQRIARLFKNFGGVAKAANLLELGAHGDLAVMRTPPERSLVASFQLGGYDLLLYAHILMFVVILACCRWCSWSSSCGTRKSTGVENVRKQKTQ